MNGTPLEYITRLYHLYQKPGGKEAHFEVSGLRLHSQRETECEIESAGEVVLGIDTPSDTCWRLLERAEELHAQRVQELMTKLEKQT